MNCVLLNSILPSLVQMALGEAQSCAAGSRMSTSFEESGCTVMVHVLFEPFVARLALVIVPLLA